MSLLVLEVGYHIVLADGGHYFPVASQQQNPDFTIIMLTDHCARGHHLFKYVHQPIVVTYLCIHCYNNIILVVGSGLISLNDTLPYFTSGCLKPFSVKLLPFGMFLIGSYIRLLKRYIPYPLFVGKMGSACGK